jgi:hypothetical protein
VANAWFTRGWSCHNAGTRFGPGRHGDHRRGDRSQVAGADRFIADRFIIGEYVSRAGKGVSLAIHPPGQWHPGRVAAGRV